MKCVAYRLRFVRRPRAGEDSALGEPALIRAINGSTTNLLSSDGHNGLYSAIHGNHKSSMGYDGEGWVAVHESMGSVAYRCGSSAWQGMVLVRLCASQRRSGPPVPDNGAVCNPTPSRC